MKNFPWARLFQGLAMTGGGCLLTLLPAAYTTLTGILFGLFGLAWAAVPATGWPRKRLLSCLGLSASAAVVLIMPFGQAKPYAWGMLLAGVAATGLVVYRFTRQWNSTSNVINRWNATSRRTGGTASWWKWFTTSSGWAMRRQMRVLMPSSGSLTRRQRRKVPLARFSYYLGREARRHFHAGVELCHGIFGGPRRGKTGYLAGLLVDAPGTALATTTRTDLLDLTAALRRSGGRPIYVVNTDEVGGGKWPSNLRWSPVSGCENKVFADERAADMLPLSGGDDGKRWDTDGRNLLALLLHAAALIGAGIGKVEAWRGSIGQLPTQTEILTALNGSPNKEMTQSSARALFATNDRTLTSITNAAGKALRWVTTPAAAAVGGHAPGGKDDFNVVKFLGSGGTLYLVGKSKGSAGLIGALTGEVARQAYRQADSLPGGRMDPALSLVLDEVTLICPVPLDEWTADFGGRNITIHWCAQSLAAFKNLYGEAATKVILNNTAAVLLMGGTKDPEDLRTWSELAGNVEVKVDTLDAGQRLASTSSRKDGVITSTQIAGLTKKFAVLFHADLGLPVIVRLPMAWDRKDIKKAAKASGEGQLLKDLKEDSVSGEELQRQAEDDELARRRKLRVAA